MRGYMTCSFALVGMGKLASKKPPLDLNQQPHESKSCALPIELRG